MAEKERGLRGEDGIRDADSRKKLVPQAEMQSELRPLHELPSRMVHGLPPSAVTP